MKPVQAYTPIIDPADWHELQAWVDSRGRGKGKSRGQSLLSAMDVLYCECGSVMASHKGPESIRDGYRCNRKVAMPGKHAGSCIVAALSLDKHVADRIFARLRHAADDEDTMIMLLEATRRFGKLTEAPEKAGERASLVAERADALRALEELYEDRAEGGYSGPVGRKHFLKAEAAANFRLQGAEERLVELETAANPTLPIDAWMPQDPGADPTGPDSWWGKADLADRRAFVKLFVDRIVIKKAAKYAGTGVPIASRVTMTFATIQDDSPEDQDDTA
jgi:hypothetical protein